MGTHPIFESDFDCLTVRLRGYRDVVTVVFFVAKNKAKMVFETCGPNEAMIVSGCCHKSPVMIPGGRVWVWPVCQKIQRLSLNTMTLQVHSTEVTTRQGVPINCIGVAQVKIESRNEKVLSVACTNFLGKSEKNIRQVALETMEGHQRAIMGQMTVEEIYQDRKAFAIKVFEVASTDLMNMGICVVSYTLKDVNDRGGYLKALGMGRTAQVKRDARMGQAKAKMKGEMKEAQAEQERMMSKYSNDTLVADSKREFDLRKAENKKEVETQKAIEKLAGALQEAITMQALKEEEMKIEVVKRTRQIELQDQEILRREKELEATVMKPAEAEKYRVEKIAQADKERSILEAEADAESIRIRGEAKAFAIQERSSAEAEQMRKKALAWKQYQEAAMVDMVLKTLPQIAAEIAAPLARANKVTMVSSGGGEIGAAKLTGEVLDVVRRLPAVVEAMTGVQLMPTK